MNEIKITGAQRRWLNSRGGRGDYDVFQDKDGLFVWFGNGDGGQMKVRLPENDYLLNEEKKNVFGI